MLTQHSSKSAARMGTNMSPYLFLPCLKALSSLLITLAFALHLADEAQVISDTGQTGSQGQCQRKSRASSAKWKAEANATREELQASLEAFQARHEESLAGTYDWNTLHEAACGSSAAVQIRPSTHEHNRMQPEEHCSM